MCKPNKPTMKEVGNQQRWEQPLVFLVPAGVPTGTQEVTPRSASSESTRCLTSGAPTMAAGMFWRLNRGPPRSPSPSSVASTATGSHQRTSIHVRFIRAWLAAAVRLATWLSSGRVAPLFQTADRIEEEFASDVDATRRRSPNVTDWSRLFHLVLRYCFVSAINLFQHQFEKKKKKSRNLFHMAHMAATDLCYHWAFFWCLNF